MPIKFLEDDEVAQPTVSDSVQIQQPTQQKKTIRFLDDNPPIQQAQPLSYTMGTDPEVDKHLDDTKAQWEGIASHLFTERELLDIRAKGEIGYFESFANNIKIPGASTGWEIAQTIDMANLSRKYSDGTINDGEKKALFDFARSMAEEQIRGYTFMGKVGSAYAQAPAFMIEFAASLGVGKLAASAALKTAEKKVASEVSEGITKEVVKKTVAQKVAQGAVTHGVGATALIAQQAPLGYAERRLNQHLSITDKGEALFTEAQEKPFTSALKAAGSVGVEYVSEISGAAIGKAIVQPVGKIVSPYTNKIGSSLIDRVPSNVKDALFRAYKTVNPNARVEKAFTAAGWNGMIEELGEERVADILRVTLDLDEKEGYSFDQVMTALYPGAEQLLVEAGTITMIGGSRVALNGAANQLHKIAMKKGISEKDATEMVNNLSQTEIETLFGGMSAQEVKTQIQQVEGAAFELARGQRIDEEEARAWSKVMASNSLWGAVNYNISPKQYFDRLQIGLQNYNAPMTAKEADEFSMSGFEPDFSGGVALPYQSSIDTMRSHQKKIDAANARTANAMDKASAEGRKYKGGKKKSETPILNFLKSKGGVLIGSELAGELETMGVTSKTHPWLFRKKNARVATAQGVVEIPALKSLDTIDPKEINDKTGKSFVASGTSSSDKDGYYVSQRDIYQAIDNEIRGIGQQETGNQTNDAWFDDMLNTLDRAGVSLYNTDEEINAALMELSRSYNYDDGQTYFQGQLKTDTEAFKKWFGDSKVVDTDGNPLVVYHGTDQNIEEFQGVSWFTPDAKDASSYADVLTPNAPHNPNVLPVYLSIKKPKIIDYYATRDDVEKARLSKRYDGVIIRNVGGSEKSHYVTFSPTQIKSVNNQGTFDANDTRILYQNEGPKTLDELYEKINSWPEFDGSMVGFFEDKNGDILLNAIEIKAGNRSNGVGTKVMNEITNYADRKGVRILLSPSTDFGATSVSRLKSFYKRFGFFENKGKNKDFTTRETMIRDPKNTFNQDARASVQFMRDGRKIISLLAGADKSSLLHETGHIFLRELMNAAQVSDIAKGQLDAVRKYVGAKDGQEFTVENEETFARGFERYLMEGTAPNNYLRDAFESFRDWLIEIYNNVMGLNAPMNNEAREFFDALLGGKDLDIYMRPVEIENHESGWAKFYRYMVDDLNPIHRAVKAAQSVRGAFPDGTNPEWLARLFAASKGRLVENIQNQTYYIDDKGNPVITGEGFKPILEDFDAEFARVEPDHETRFEDLKQYLIARRYIEDLDKRDDVEVSAKQLEESADTIARIGEKYGDNAIRFQDYAERIYGFQKRILENLVRSGIMSQESFDAITKDNQHYIPFQRVFDENEIDESFFSLGGRGRFVTQSNPVKSIEGSTREVKDPFSQIIINSARILMAAERNRVSAGIAAMAAYLPDNIQPVKQPMKKITLDDGTVTYRPDGIPDGTVIEYRTDGKRRFVKVSKPMYEALQGMHPHQANMFERIFTGISSFFRGAATLPPDFWIRNFIRDVNSASVQSKHGLKPVDVIKGILAVAKKNDLYHEWMKAGGSFNSYMELDDKGAQKAFEELLRPQGRTMRYVKSGGIELLKDASGAVEQATRIAMFARARAKGETAIGAALQSRDGTLDFSRAGKWGRVANRYIPFLNAGIQGSDKLIRAFRDQPAVMTWRAFMTISIPSIVLTGYYLYGAPDDEREEYLEIPQWQKDMFWCFKANGEWWRIPKPFALGYAFGSLPERFLLWSYQGEKPEAENIWREFVLGLGGSLSPIQDVGTLMTPVGRIVVESLSNYNFFTDRPIYPKWMESLPMEERATKHQSETAMLLGELSGQSPAIIENAIRGMLATTTPYAMGASDGIINSVKEWNGETIPEKPMTPSDKMFVRGFSVRTPEGYRSVSASNFFDKWEEIKQHNTSFNRKHGEERSEYREKYDKQIRAYKPMKGYYDRMDSLQERVDSIYENDSMTGEEKLSEIRDIEKQITEIAREANKWYIFNVRNEE